MAVHFRSPRAGLLRPAPERPMAMRTPQGAQGLAFLRRCELGTMRVADYITDALFNAGGKTVFGVTGGMIMHLTDALRSHPHQKFVACHHETPAVMAADAYGRYTNRLGVAYVTAGPGALNTLTGVVGAYVDSAPVVIVAGQSKLDQAVVTGPRQFALQGFDTLGIFKRVTKYAVMLDSPNTVKYHVEKSIHEATHGRKGPVWIEVPVDVQGMEMPLGGGFPPAPVYFPEPIPEAEKVARLLKQSKRPVILAGAGIRSSGLEALAAFDTFYPRHRVPVMTSRLGMDLIDHSDPLFIGRPGTYGDRPANFACQNADLIIVLGCRLGIGLVGYGFKEWGKRAVKVMVDVDAAELNKPSVVPDVQIQADAGEFLRLLHACLADWRFGKDSWLDRIQEWRTRYPVDLPEYSSQEPLNSYHFMRLFSEEMDPIDRFVVDTGSCFHVHAQAFKVRLGQRHIITGGLSTMGFMPASIGVAAANDTAPVWCITGDGSLQMHLQELATIAHHRFPIKLIVFNNDGYLLIRNTQKNFQGGRLIGEGPETGLTFPDLRKLAALYGMDYVRVETADEIASAVSTLRESPAPAICEVILQPNQVLAPRVAARQRPDGTMEPGRYDDMAPFLDRAEYEANQVKE